ncbi:MAG: hypothetical protein WBY53_12535 [Acidobacteriaceae bacterium]
MLLMTGMAAAQTVAAPANTPKAPQPVVQYGFVVHETVDLGGHIAGVFGSGSMYDTLVNIQSGPRVLGETFTLRAVPGTKHHLLDTLSAFSDGFGGDPSNFAKLDFSKGKLYEFTGTFRRDRQYFDYDLLDNPLIPPGQGMPYGEGVLAGQKTGVVTPATVPWQQYYDSPVMFNTVRRMTDTNLTLFPLSKLTFRVAYAQNIFQGPSLSPGQSVGKEDALLEEYQRNSTDDFIGAIDWKPLQQTKITLQEQVTHYKENSYFTIAPNQYIAQEANGTRVSVGDWNSTTPVAMSTICNTASMGSTAYSSSTNYVLFTAPQTPGGLPTINAACDVITSYLRSQPTRVLYPTELVQFQSSSIKNIATNGDFRYTEARSTLPNYNETYNGLDGATRVSQITGWAYAKRHDVGADYGITWHALKNFNFSDQASFSDVKEPGSYSTATNTWAVPTTAGNETINYPTLTQAALKVPAAFVPFGAAQSTTFFGQKIITNNLTATWNASSRATVSVTYRYRANTIVQGSDAYTTSRLTETIFEDGGIVNVALRPTNHWDINGSMEALYQDNAFTSLTPRQLQHYRIHTMYRPKSWATVTAAFNDQERRNNTNNDGTANATVGPLDHLDHTRVAGLGAVLAPSEHYALDLNYGYTDVYTTTNGTFPGDPVGYTASASTVANPIPDFADAHTQYFSAAIALTPVKSIHGDIGYRISSVGGNQILYPQTLVNGSLDSAYQSPYVKVAWTVHPGWVWAGEYNYYGYGEGGPVNTLSDNGLIGNTAPRDFHANLLTLSMHYEF